MCIFRILIVAILIQFPLEAQAVDYIAGQDRQRITAFDARREERDALPFTQAINTRLTNHSNIDYSRTATENDKKTIFTAVIGEAIVHDRTLLARSPTVLDPNYRRHCDALDVVAGSALFL